MQPVEFGTYDYGDGLEGRFYWGEERNMLFDQFYQACEILQGGDRERGKNKMRAILKKDPEFIDAYNEIGADFSDRGNDEKALEYYLRAYNIAQPLIPENFSGIILWGQLANRPYLRTLQGLAISYARLNQEDKAIPLFERGLRYNPNDNLGIRYHLGNLYLKKMDYKNADMYFQENCDEYPPYRYGYGASLFLQGRHIDALYQFWHGFLENIYIAHLILGHAPVIAYQCAHLTNFEMPQIAKQYYRDNMELWFDHSEIVQFISNVYHSHLVRAYISRFFEAKESLQFIASTTPEQLNERQEVLAYLDELQCDITVEKARQLYRDIS